MNKILILFITVLSLYGNVGSVKNINIATVEFGNIQTTPKVFDKQTSKFIDDDKYSHAYNYLFLNSLFYLNYEHVFIKLGGTYNSTRNYMSELQSVGIDRLRDEDINEASLTDASLNIIFTKENIFTIGVLDVSRGIGSDYVSGIKPNSPSINTLVNGQTDGMFFSHYINGNKHNFKLGYSRIGLFRKDTENNIGAHGGNNSEYYFYMHKYKNDSTTFYFNYIYSNDYLSTKNINIFKKDLEKDIKFGNTHVASIHISKVINDSTFYTTAGVMSKKFDTSMFALDGQKTVIGDIDFSKSDHIGYNILFGYSNIMDSKIFKREIVHGIELYKSSKYWLPYIRGDYTNDYGFAKHGKTITLYTIFHINNHCKLSFNFLKSYIDNDNKFISINTVQRKRTYKKTFIKLIYRF